jgi:hypothetical protein
MVGIRGRTVIYLILLCWNVELCFSVVSSPENFALTDTTTNDIVKHSVNQANLRPSDSQGLLSRDIIYYFMPVNHEDKWRDDWRSLSGGCESLHGVTNQIIAAESNLKQLQVQLKCGVDLAICEQAGAVAATVEAAVCVSFALTAVIHDCKESQAVLEHLLTEYQSYLNIFMQERMFTPIIAAYTVQSDFLVQATSTAPTSAPADDEPLNTMQMLVMLGIFFVGLVLVISSICFLAMRKRMNTIVVGIG